MSDTSITLDLHNRQQAYALIKEQLYPFIGHWMQAQKRLVLSCGLRKRTVKQNKRYWGGCVLKQIAEQAAPAGRLYAAETWHEQFKRQFIGVIELPNGDVVGKSSTDLNTAEFCEFCDKVEAYACTDLGVIFYDLPDRAAC